MKNPRGTKVIRGFFVFRCLLTTKLYANLTQIVRLAGEAGHVASLLAKSSFEVTFVFDICFSAERYLTYFT